MLQKRILVILYLLLVIDGITSFIAHFGPVQEVNFYIDIRVTSLIIALLLYLGLSLYGVISFAHKLYQLLKNNEETHNELLYATTKYTTLLSLAMISTWITGSYGAVFAVIWPSLEGDSLTINLTIQNSLPYIDTVINVICLSLRYSFNKKYYDKYCTCCTKCCVYVLAQKVMKMGFRVI